MDAQLLALFFCELNETLSDDINDTITYYQAQQP